MSDFKQLTVTIGNLHDTLRGVAAVSVNRLLTMRNWLIGMHIVEYEQKGEDRAQYGAGLLRDLSQKLTGSGLKGFSHTNLKLFRQFYMEYQRLGSIFKMQKQAIGQEVADQLDCRLNEIGQKPSDQSADSSVIPDKESDKFKAMQSGSDFSPSSEKLIKHFSFSHFVELMRIQDPLKRAFYEVEGIKGYWSVPQLKRQIESLLYERTGLSRNKAGVVEAANRQNSPAHIEDLLRDPYVLEFTGLPERHEYSETDLETALLDHIQSFLLELGNGFCFEARQKRITLDNEHDRVDLVFYHRILRCHALIDLKVRKFRSSDAGQMNFYLNYFRENVMAEGDNPPVGLILCTDREETRVKYATAGMDNQMFVSKYLTALPSEEKIREFLQSDRDRTENVLRERQAHYDA